MKKISTGIFVIACLGFSNLFSFDISDISVKNGKSSYFSKITKSVTDCVAENLSNGVPQFDICSIEKELNKVSDKLDKKIKKALRIEAKFNIAGCSFSANADPLKCTKGMLSSYCSNSDNPLRRSKIKRGMQNYLTTATGKYAEYGDSEIMGKACMTFEEKSKKTPNRTKVYGNNKYEGILMTLNGGKWANTRVGKDVLKCIIDAKRNGYDENSCYPQYDTIDNNHREVEITDVQVQEENHKQATIVLASPLKDKISNLRNEEISLSSKIFNKCKGNKSTEKTQQCVEDYLKDTYQINRKVSDIKVDITKNIAGFSEVMEDATTPYRTMTQPTEYTAEKLPTEQKEKYRRLSVRYMAQKSVIQSQIKRIANMERQLAELMYKKVEVSSRQFFPEVAKKELGIE